MKLSICPFALILCILFISCGTNGEKDKSAYLSDSTSITGLTGDSAKVIKTASLNLKVKDIDQGSRAVSKLAKSLGGLIFDQSLDYTETSTNELKVSSDSLMAISVSTPKADISVRVPSENLEAFIFGAIDIGYYTANSRLQIKDQSLVYLENLLRQKNRAQALMPATPVVQKPLTKVQSINVGDEVIEQQIANKAIDVDVKYSTVTLNLFQSPVVRKEMIANYNLADYQLPFKRRFINSLSDGWEYFLTFVVSVANLWMFVLVALLVYFIYRCYQQKKSSSLKFEPAIKFGKSEPENGDR